MVKKNNFIALLFITIFTFSLTACNKENVKEEIPEPVATTGKTGENVDIDLRGISHRADLAYQNNDLESSEKDYALLIQHLPEEPSHWFRLANIYVRTNRPQAAIDLYREAIIRDPKFSKAWYNLSIVQLKQTAYSLGEMLAYTDENDPLHKRARDLLEGIEAIIKID